MQGASEMGSKDPRKERRSQGSSNSYQGQMTLMETFCRVHLKQSKNGTIITKISEKQRKERWLKSGMILSVQNCEIKKHQ